MKKKKIILSTIVVVLLFIVITLIYMVLDKYFLKKQFENSLFSFKTKNEETIFKIEKITFFSSADAMNKTATASSFTIENLYQFTDMAFFITSPSTEKDFSNTFKEVYINNLNFENTPSIGEPKLYYKNINDFAKSTIVEENLITDNLHFDISSAENADLAKPVLYNNLANPIVLSYVNNNLKTDYTLTALSKSITYDGSLLKACGILLNNIACRISFDIYIVNNLNQEFKCTVYTDIPLKTEEKTIFDGNIKLEKTTNFTFYRYK